MTRTLIPSPRHALILKMILAGNTQRQISKALKISPPNLSRIIRRLEKYQYLVRLYRSNHVQFTLTLNGYGLLSSKIPKEPIDKITQGDQIDKGNYHMETQEATITEKPRKYWRLHRLQFKIPFIEPLKSNEIHLIKLKDHPVKLRALWNHNDLIVEFQNFVCTLTTRALKITGIQIRMPYEEVEDPHELLDKAAQIFMPEIENLEAFFKKYYPIKLKRMSNNVFDVKLVIGELAIEQDELALNVDTVSKKTGQKLRVYDPEDGTLSMIVDKSMGPPEIESKHKRKFMDNMEIYQSFLTDLISGKFYQGLTALSEGISSLETSSKKIMDLHSEGYKQHDERINQVMDLIEKLALTVNKSIMDLTDKIAQIGGR